MAVPSVHSCTQLTDLNEKLMHRLKKLKKRNDALEKELSSINEQIKIENLLREHCKIRHVGVQTELHPRGSWRVIKQPPPQTKTQEDNSQKTIESLMKNHKSLMRRYEREVRANTKHIETVASLNLRIQELEKLLSSANERVRLLEGQTQRYTPHGWSTPRDHVQNRSRTTPGQRRMRSRSRQSYSPDNYSQELETVRRERDRLKKDKHKLKKELGALDENFFEEIEDLKFALQQSARLNQEYDKALKQVCENFGAPFPLDSLPSRPKKSSSASKRPPLSRQTR
nr:centrosomal protein of 290 kDa-like [Lytechinus pictus]